MKANGLNGEYCQNCAMILDDVQRNHRRVIVLDSQCAAVFQQSGDAALLDEQASTIPHVPGGTVPAELVEPEIYQKFNKPMVPQDKSEHPKLPAKTTPAKKSAR